MTNTDAPRTDRYGFPIRTCTRCGGSGTYSYNRLDGNRCFGCGGTGLQHTPKAAKAIKAYREAVKAARRPVAEALEPGDVVTFDVAFSGGPREGAEWREVAKVGVLPTWGGSSLTGTDEADRVHFWMRCLYFTDGTFKVCNPHTLTYRTRAVDVAPFVAAAL